MSETTITDQIITKLNRDAGMTYLQFLALEITEFKQSTARSLMLAGERYYSGDHDINRRKRTAIGKDGELIEVKTLPNNRIIDNQYAKHVDQKKNYLLGKPLTFSGEDNACIKAVKNVLAKRFMRTLKNVVCDALNGGIAWLYAYYDTFGELAFRSFKPYEILPFWADNAHTKLDCAARIYTVEVYKNKQKTLVEKVDIFSLDGVITYTFDSDILVADGEKSSYVTMVEGGVESAYNWERIPLIPIKYNQAEIPLIRRVKQLQDAINLLLSDFVNNMSEDIHKTVLVLNNYDGTNLGEFRYNLATYGVIKVRSNEGVAGDVDTLTIEVNSENYKTILELLKKALIENARSYDGKDDRLSGTPNQMNIQSMYSDIDLDANDMETELQATFEDIFWFVNRYLGNTEAQAITTTFNRDMLINESEAIQNCTKSVGIISNETIVSQHPWTLDVARELARVKAEIAEQSEYAEAYTSDADTTSKPPTKGGVVGEK